MSKLKFLGFTDGSQVNIQALTDGQTAVATVEEWGISANIEVTMSRSILGVAPERVTFEVTGWSGFETPVPNANADYNPLLHEVIYAIDFGDAGSVYTAPVHKLDAWSNRNLGFGPLVSHVFRKPGTYPVTIWAYELGSTARAKWTTTLTIADPDAVFAGGDTAYISVNGDFSNAPAGAYTNTSLAAAVASRKSREKTRYMLRCGETHTDISNIELRNSGHSHFVNDYARVNDLDVGYVRPILLAADAQGYVIRSRDTTNDFVYQGLDIRGQWDSTTETGRPNQDGISVLAGQPTPRHLLVDNCRIDGFRVGVAHTGGSGSTPESCGLSIHDTYITNWRDYGVYCGGAAWTDFLGATIVQHVDALGGGPKDGFHNNHGCVRLQPGTKAFSTVDGSDMYSRTGWFQNVSGYFTQQACFRFNQGGVPGSLLNVQRSAFEGGWEILKLTMSNDAYYEGVQNVIIDKVVLVGTHMTRRGISLEGGAVTVRNCLMIMPYVSRIDGTFDPTAFVEAEAPTVNPAAANAPVKVYHNTLINLMTEAHAAGPSAQMSMLRDQAGIFSTVVQNNLMHQPNLDTPDVEHHPLSIQTLWQPREEGYVSDIHTTRLIQYATPDDTVQLGAPMTRSIALGGALQDPFLFYDIHGNTRPSIPSIGAMERTQDN